MNDYKEQIEMLRNMSKAIIREDAKLVDIPEENIWDADANALVDAADAIEQLVSDYEILAKMYAKVNEDLCVRTKERDAAVEDLKQHVYESGECFACRHYIWETDRCDRSDEAAEPDEDTCWEWRGCRRRTDES